MTNILYVVVFCICFFGICFLVMFLVGKLVEKEYKKNPDKFCKSWNKYLKTYGSGLDQYNDKDVLRIIYSNSKTNRKFKDWKY